MPPLTAHDLHFRLAYRYGALRNLEFVVADFFAAAVPTFLPPLGSARGKPFDVVYLAPPWGGFVVCCFVTLCTIRRILVEGLCSFVVQLVR